MADVPNLRIRALNGRGLRADGEFVLYWMTAARRTRWNFGLQRAAARARDLGRPILVLEALRCDYRWASDRLHVFVLRGMADNQKRLAGTGAGYYPYVERAPGQGRGLLEALAERACAVVTDDYPCFFLPRMAAAAAEKVPVLVEAVDSNGLLPMRSAGRSFATAYAFRRHLQGELPLHLGAVPESDPLAKRALPPFTGLPEPIARRWPAAAPGFLRAPDLSALPIDHGVAPVEGTPGGEAAARGALQAFVRERLERYAEDRNQPGREGTSGLSAYLHFGHLSAHEVFAEVTVARAWHPGMLPPRGRGAREGWWGLPPSHEAFLDQLVTWRELGFNACAFMDDYDRYESLPPWALRTLEDHGRDSRPHLYSPEQLDEAATHDPLWNASQTQLRLEGRIHGYLRMLWGKKILEWSPTPREALAVMLELNNRHALDGRDPNSYSGIFWVLGRYDRPWAPARPIFGSVRYMSTRSAARKLRVDGYVSRYAPAPARPK